MDKINCKAFKSAKPYKNRSVILNKKFSLFLSHLAALAMLYFSSAMADDFAQIFIQKYKNEMLPELRLSKIDRYKAQGLTEEQINRELEKLVSQAADCQFKTFEAYDEKYQQVAFNTLVTGGTTEDAALQLNEAMDNDLEKGKISPKEVSSRVKKAMGLYASCVVNSGLVNQ
jgi:hypothetical protein